MFDWKEFFPVDALAPLVGGLLLWFGVNYLVLAPNVIGPRLAERYYLPACVAGVEQGRSQMAGRLRQMDQEIETALRQLGAQAAEGVQNQLGSILGQVLGMYGAEGQAFKDRYGSQLGGSFGGMVGVGIEAKLAEQRAAMQAEKERQIAEMRAQQKFSSPAQFCGCNVGEGLSDRLELALFTSSLRLYTPPRMEALNRGEIFGAQCGAAPVL